MEHVTKNERIPLRFLQGLTLLAIIGAINWGLVGFFGFNLVDAIFGGGAMERTSPASRVIYAIIGLAGLGALFFLPARLPGGNPEDPTVSRPHRTAR